MGCNFYTLQGIHIGKRSAAGLYCWDCGLSVYGDTCSTCGQSATFESLEKSAAGRELGFNTQEFKPKTGIKSCSSFNWANKECIKNKRFVKDEYGRKYTISEFKKMLTECPIQYTDMMGREFS